MMHQNYKSANFMKTTDSNIRLKSSTSSNIQSIKDSCSSRNKNSLCKPTTEQEKFLT